MQSVLSTVIWLSIILSPRKKRIVSKWRSSWLERDHKIRLDRRPMPALQREERDSVSERGRVKQVRAATGYLRQWHRTEPTGFGWNRVRVLEFWERNSFNLNIVASGSFARVSYTKHDRVQKNRRIREICYSARPPFSSVNKTWRS